MSENRKIAAIEGKCHEVILEDLSLAKKCFFYQLAIKFRYFSQDTYLPYSLC